MKKFDLLLAVFVISGFSAIGITSDIERSPTVTTRKNSTGSDFTRKRLNLIEGSNITITMSDDPTSNEIDTTIASSGGGGGASSLAIATGTISGFTVPGTSPTAVINFNSSLFTATLAGSATSFISLVLSSVTALGSDIDLASTEVTGTLPVARGGTNLTAANDDDVMVGNGTTWETKDLGSCSAASQALTYNTGTNAFGCNTITASAAASTRTFVYTAEALTPSTTGTQFAPLESTDTANVQYYFRAFDDTIVEYAGSAFTAPDNMVSGGTVTFRLCGRAKTAAAAVNVEFDFEHMALAATESMGGTWTAENSGDIAITNTQGVMNCGTWTEHLTNLAWSANDQVKWRVSRTAPAGTDLTGDFYLWLFTLYIPVQ